MSVFLQPIYTQTVGAGGALAVTFNNIPQGYSDLKIVISARSTASSNDAVAFQFNGDTSNSYSDTRIFGDGSGAYSDKPAGYNFTPLYANIPTATSTANTFGNTELYISNYSSGNKKSYILDVICENNTASTNTYQMLIAGLYNKTNPITSITFFTTNTVNFAQYSTFTLYGVAEQYSTQTPVAPTITSIVDQAGFASVNFLPTAPDNATVYAVTDNNNNTTYGAGSPIVAPVTLGSNTTFTAKTINNLATTSAAGTASITSNNSYASIATVYASSGTISNAVFNNIPQNYTHLQIRAFARGGSTSFAAGLSFYIQFNGDTTAANYNLHGLYGDGSSAYGSSSLGTGSLSAQQLFTDTSAPSNTFGAGIVDILDYANTTKYKTARYIGGHDQNGSGRAMAYSGFWSSISPITSITVAIDGNFAQYSHIALYGIA